MRNTSQAISCELNTVLNSANRHLWIVKKAQSDFLFSPPKTHGSWLVMPSKHPLWSMLHWAMHKTAELSVFVDGRQCMLLFVLFETIPTNKCKTLSLLLILQVRLISNWPSGQIFIITVYLCAWQKKWLWAQSDQKKFSYLLLWRNRIAAWYPVSLVCQVNDLWLREIYMS